MVYNFDIMSTYYNILFRHYHLFLNFNDVLHYFFGKKKNNDVNFNKEKIKLEWALIKNNMGFCVLLEK